MEFRLNETQETIRQLAKQLAEKYVAPLSEEIDQTHTTPLELFKTIAQLPSSYGVLIVVIVLIIDIVS